MLSNLDHLKKITEDLPAVPRLADFVVAKSNSSIEFDVGIGTCISYNLYSQNKVSVARTFVSSGGVLPKHKHLEKEILVVYSGRAIFYLDKEGKKTILNEGDSVEINPETPHRIRALEDTWFIAISVPQSKDFPSDD